MSMPEVKDTKDTKEVKVVKEEVKVVKEVKEVKEVSDERIDVKLFGFLKYSPGEMPSVLMNLERSRYFRIGIGVIFSLNFVLFWSVPIAVQVS